jgi:hypothetical protein
MMKIWFLFKVWKLITRKQANNIILLFYEYFHVFEKVLDDEIRKYENVKMWKYENMKISKNENMKIWKYD